MKVVILDDSASMVQSFEGDRLFEVLEDFREDQEFVAFALDDRKIRPLGAFWDANALLDDTVFSSTRSRLWDSMTLLILHLAKVEDPTDPFDIAVITDGLVMDSIYSSPQLVSRLMKRKMEDGWTFQFFDMDFDKWNKIQRYDRLDS